MGRRIAKFDTSAETPENQQNLAMGGKKKFTLRDLNRLVPLTYNQQKFKDIYNSGVEVIFQLGAAGAGKTTLALSEAFAEVLDPSLIMIKLLLFVAPWQYEK